MKKTLILCLLIPFIQQSLATTIFWIGTVGLYSDGTNWNTQANGLGTFGVPLNTDDIVISKNAIITIDGTYNPASVWITSNSIVNFTNTATSKTYTIGGSATVSPAFKIEAGSTLNVLGTASIILQVLTGSAAQIYGTLDISGSSSRMNYTIGQGITRVKSGGKIRYGGTSSNGTGSVANFFMEAGSTYEVYKNGGSFPTGTYDPLSLVLNTGAVANMSTFSMSAATGSYGNYEFNNPSYTGTTVGLNQNISVNNFTLTDDGSGKWVFSTSPATAYTFTINGNLSQAPNTTIDINRGASGSQATTLLVKGDITSSGVITESNGNTGSVIELGGAGSIHLSLDNTTLTNDVSLIINKSGTVVLLTDLLMPNSASAKLTLTNGYIDGLINNKTVFIQYPGTGSLVGGSVTSHIIGYLNRATNLVAVYAFPISNNSAQLANAAITPSSTSTTNFTVSFSDVNPDAGNGLTPGVIEVVTPYYWNVTRSGATPADIGFLSLYYNNLTNSYISDPSQAKVVHWSGTIWENLGGINNPGNITNVLGSTGGVAPGDPINVFGSFAIGGVLSVLPLSIEYFNGVKNGNEHRLAWKVDCTNSTHVTITVECSKDGRTFSTLQEMVADAVRCQQPFSHSYVAPYRGFNFYRLKLTDADGHKVYSNIVSLANNGFEILSLSPNPSGNWLLNINDSQPENIMVVVSGMDGRIVSRKSYKAIAGNNGFNIPTTNLSTGIYQVTVYGEDGYRFTGRIVKQ